MTAVVPTRVYTMDPRNDFCYGTTEKSFRIVIVEVTTTATSNTTDLTTYVSGGCSGIAGVLFNSIDGAVTATAPTWSTTTVTWAQHAGSGVVVCGFLVY